MQSEKPQENACFLLITAEPISTVQYPREIHLRFGSGALFPRYLKFTAVRESAEHNVPQSVIAIASDNPVVGYAIGKGISFSFELMSVSYPHCLNAYSNPYGIHPVVKGVISDIQCKTI